MPFQTRRAELITPDQSERIHAVARRILAEIGLEVRQPAYQEQLRASGFRIEADRLYIEASVVDEFVDEHRRRLQRWLKEDEFSLRRMSASSPSASPPTLSTSKICTAVKSCRSRLSV